MYIKRGSKRGQEVIGMSFNTIISIIIIMAIIGVAIYVFVYIVGVNKCTKSGFFYEDLQKEINSAWTSGRYSKIYEGEIASSGILKSGVEFVCFGDRSASSSGQDEIRQEDIKFNNKYNQDSNIFLYPSGDICPGLESKKLEHVNISSFFCIDVKESSGKINIRIEKSTRDNLVTLKND